MHTGKYLSTIRITTVTRIVDMTNSYDIWWVGMGGIPHERFCIKRGGKLYGYAVYASGTERADAYMHAG